MSLCNPPVNIFALGLFSIFFLASCGMLGNFSPAPATVSVPSYQVPTMPTPEYPAMPQGVSNSIDGVERLGNAANRLQAFNPIPASGSEIPREAQIEIQADQHLNTDAYQRSFSVVVRIYQLQQSNAFQQAFYDVFLDTQKAQEAFGYDVVSTKEITLVPGKNYSHTENIDTRTGYIGVVVLYRTPAAERWKLTFPIKSQNMNGISLGIHACSITVRAGISVEYGSQTPNTLKFPTSCQ